jgi:broad specificity phosphatase PhoE/ribonuclease HI
VSSGLRVIIEADGGSRGNPGPAGYGAVVFDAATHAVLAERFESIGIDTNNVAEYRGLIAGLEAALELGATSVAVRMDSKLVIEQMSGRWQVKHPSMLPLARRAAALLANFEDATFEWIPRAQNSHADGLANQAMDGAAITASEASDFDSPTINSPTVNSPEPTLNWSPPEGQATRVLLVRHGRTAHTTAKLFSGRNEEPLSDEGEHEAAALAQRLARTGGIAAVLSSPLTRTAQTAARIATALSLPVVTMDALIETDFGVWEGRTGIEIQSRWPDEFRAWVTTANAAPPDGESFEQVARRVRRARDEIVRTYAGQTVVLVSHVTPIKTLLRLALDAPQSAMVRLHLDPASVSEVSYFADGTASVRLFNDTSHLQFPAS